MISRSNNTTRLFEEKLLDATDRAIQKSKDVLEAIQLEPDQLCIELKQHIVDEVGANREGQRKKFNEIVSMLEKHGTKVNFTFEKVFGPEE